MKIDKIDQSGYYHIVDSCEEYLINKLDEIFGQGICINDYNNDGTINQTGGNGTKHKAGNNQ